MGTFQALVCHLPMASNGTATSKKERASSCAAHILGSGSLVIFYSYFCKCTSMTALIKPIQPDRSKIDMRDSRQVRAWAKRLSISAAQLQKVVETVGNNAVEVMKELGRSRCQG